MKKLSTKFHSLLSVRTSVATPQCGEKFYTSITFLVQSLLKACPSPQNPKLFRLRFFPPQVSITFFGSSSHCIFLTFHVQRCPLQKLPKKWVPVQRLSCSVRHPSAARTTISHPALLSSKVRFFFFFFSFCIGLSCFCSSYL